MKKVLFVATVVKTMLTFLRAISSAVRVLAPGRSDMMSASDVA